MARPRKAMLGKLASVLDLSQSELSTPVRPEADHSRSAPKAVMPLPIRPLTNMLPLMHLTTADFERFVVDLLDRRFPESQVIPLGGQGDDQRGYDILVVHSDGRRVGVQCKREQQFGPKKVAAAISEAELAVHESVIALARPATAEARFEVDRHAGWGIWDQADLSRFVRRLPPESSLHLVRAFFPSHVEAFLGVSPANPWMTAEEFYRASPFAVLNHRQPLVARQGLVDDIAGWASDPASTDIAVVVGRGGLGKSKLLWEVATRIYPEETHYRFVTVGREPTPDDFDVLPRTGRLIVVLDDAHGMDGVAGLAAQLWKQRPGAKILMATRPYGEKQLDTEVWKLNQPPRSIKRWELDDLPYAKACELVSGLISRPVTDPFTRQLAAISDDCPFIAVVAADLYRREELTGKRLESEAALRTDVFRRFADQMAGRATGTDAAERRDVLSAVAAFQPVRLDDPLFASAMTSLAKIESWDDINRHIRELEDAGLLLRRGSNAVRVVPDMFGDVLLGQAAYDDRSGRPTKYLARARAGATRLPLQHLSVNASRIDWQVGGDLSRAHVVDDLWSTLHSELLDGTFDEQLELLKLLAKVAYYQPQAALNLVKGVLALETDSVQEDPHSTELGWASTRQDVVHAAAPVLRNIAYHLDYLRPSLDLLWTLAQDDDRPTHQFPDHPLRILREIADLSTGKPFEYIHNVIDAASAWLTNNAAPVQCSPFDVLEPILATEGSEQIWSEDALTFYPFGIKPESVRDLRSRVLDIAFHEASSNDTRRAVRAIETLERGIQGPAGQFNRVPSDAESEAWAREFVPIIEKLGELGADPERDPAIRIAIREAIGHAAYSKTQTKAAADIALASLAHTPEDDLALHLHDGWGRMTRPTGLDFQEAERVRTDEYRRIAEMISTGRTDRETLDHLEHRLHIEHTAADGFDSAGHFLWVFFERKPSAARELCEAAMAGQFPELRHFLAVALAALASAGDHRAIEYASSMIGDDSGELQRAAARALSWNRGPRSQLLPGEADVLSTMAVHPDERVRADAGRAVFLVALADKAAALDLLAKIDFGSSRHIAAEALSSFNPQGPLRWPDTDASLRQAILSRLVECTSIDDYLLMSALSELSFVEPLGVTRLLLARISRETDTDLPRYEALPDRWDPPLRVSETVKLAQCLVEVTDLMTEMGCDRWTYYPYDHGSSLYGLLAREWSGQAIAVLEDLADTRSEAALLTVARTLTKAPTEVLFGQVALLAKVLWRAESFGKGMAEQTFKVLVRSNFAAVWTFSQGQRQAKEEHDRDRAREIARELPRGSIESRFFHTFADMLEARISWMMDSPEPRDDGRDW